MAGMSVVQANVLVEFRWQCQNNLQGAGYNPTTNAGDLRKTYNVGTAATNAASGGGDEVFSFQQSISPGSAATLDLTTMTNLLQQAGVSITRIKAVVFKLLSAVDDTTVAANSAGVTLTNAQPTGGLGLPAALFPNGGSGLTLTLTVAAGAVTAAAIGAAGSGYPPSSTFLVAPQQAGGSGAVIAVTTNASGVPTTVALVAGAGGGGYTAATVPAAVLGSALLGGGVSGTGLTLALTTSGGAVTAVAIGAAGSGYPPSLTFNVAPVQGGGSGAVVSVTTNAAGVPTAVSLVSGGAGYTNATVPTVPLGPAVQGGCYCYFDATAGGFLNVSATGKNVRFANLDPINAATVECNFLAATT